MLDIIVADDDASVRGFLSELLMKKNCRAILAKNGVQAWEQLKSSGARIVITDWMMPEMSGIELCERIRADKDMDYIYIIIVSGNERKKDAIEGLKAGADDYITKPFLVDELWARIRTGKRIIDLEDNNKKVMAQLYQADKMSSIGQLAAGVAHEINNPVGFVTSNLKTLSEYVSDIKRVIDSYRVLMAVLEKKNKVLKSIAPDLIEPFLAARNIEEKIDIKFIIKDSHDIINDCLEGSERITKIVSDLKDFAHPGHTKMQLANIADGIDSTLNVIQNEIRYKADIIKIYGNIPSIVCYPQQLNQVFMNILINAAHSIEGKGEIKIVTGFSNGWVEVAISDNGAGIESKNLTKIFDPFFTTKVVGQGTGLGMNVAYNIIQKHGGTIEVQSELGKGSVFTVRIPQKMEAK